MRVASLAWAAGCCASYFLHKTVHLVLAKLVKGAGVGLASVAAPVYLFETIRPSRRGGAISFLHFLAGVGALAMYGLSGVFQHYYKSEKALHYLWASEGIWCALVLLFLWLLPESPTALGRKGHWTKATRTYARLSATRRKTLPLPPATPTLVPHTPLSYSDLFSKTLFGYSVCSVVSQIVAQLACVCGTAQFVKYMGVVCDLDPATVLGFLDAHFMLQALATLLPVLVLDRARRKDVMCFGLFMLTATYAAMGGLAKTFGEESTKVNFGPPLKMEQLPASALLGLTAFAFTLAAVSVRPASDLYCLEVLPARARAKGAAVASCASWATNAMLGAGLMPLSSEVQPYWVFFALAAICLVGMLLIVPLKETRELASTEDIPLIMRPLGDAITRISLDESGVLDSTMSEPGAKLEALDAKRSIKSESKLDARYRREKERPAMTRVDEGTIWEKSGSATRELSVRSDSSATALLQRRHMSFQNFIPLYKSAVKESTPVRGAGAAHALSSRLGANLDEADGASDLITAKSHISAASTILLRTVQNLLGEFTLSGTWTGDTA